ncbi:acetyl-CoA carboxylase biotin carboxyl carrier protein subunit [Pontibacter diazotrophicus]|uniref:Acetyl-CoA carboxylase biotin carboxyl carrier protein subunit n=1 Tax=Pontibacter diazotrophicus TaxID=1400979 RepID=A0A3D8LCT0_9BACT|nr:acetyl-CoA carboxylase biotin carboxyl carrier protein subunit [Pontibacter diazotrophicus]RDV15239.1 acetyl-CoA carboxylase biotin carboxyl carrier protein subunit [Pontibacter diazotrophicus]
MLQVKTANDKIWQVDIKNDTVILNGAPFNWDISPIGPHTYHIIKDARSYTAELVSANYEEKTFTFKINGITQTVSVKDRFDLLLDKLGMSDANAKKVNDVKAPMPGLILEIKVKPGQEVKKGDPIMILEAMKMENILKSPGDGVVKEVKVEEKQNVEKNQVLILF